MSVLECLTKFNQLILLVVNVFVAVLGICVMAVGAWAKADSRQYFSIADDNTQYTQVSVLLIVVGIFVLLIGVVGAVGALFASKAFGRVILVVYAIGLGLLVVCEIAGGIAAAVARKKVEQVFRESANKTFQQFPTDSSERDTWNQFQEDFHCCGVEGYMDYRHLFDDNAIPESCCNPNIKNESQKVDCGKINFENVTSAETKYLYQEGCADTIVDAIRKNLGAVAGSVIFLALVQIIGIVLACFVAISKKDKTYEVV